MVSPLVLSLALAAAANPASDEALDAYEAGLRTPAHLQPMSYGGGVEWTFQAEPDGPRCRIYVREYGPEDAEPWIVVHGGFGAEHSYLLDAFAGLEREVRLIFYDQRGSLRSHCPTELVTSDAHILDIERLRRVMGLERINLVGHSMGTHLTGRYLERFGQSVDRIVLLAPAHLRYPLEEADLAANPAAGDNNAAGGQMMNRDVVTAQIEAEGFGAEEELWPRERDFAWQSRPETFDLVPVLRAHPGPVSVIIGDHDFADPGAGLNRHWFEEDPGVALTVLENAGHNAWLDQPRAFRRALVEAMGTGAN